MGTEAMQLSCEPVDAHSRARRVVAGQLDESLQLTTSHIGSVSRCCHLQTHRRPAECRGQLAIIRAWPGLCDVVR